MILKIQDHTGHTVVHTTQDYDLAAELFRAAQSKGMWGKGVTVVGQSEFIPTTTPFEELLSYSEVLMLVPQVGG